MKNTGKNIIIWLAMFLLLMTLFNVIGKNIENSNTIRLTFSDFMNKVEAGEISDVVINRSEETGTSVKGHFSDGRAFYSVVPDYPNLVDKLRENNVTIDVNDLTSNVFLSVLLSWLPFLIVIGLYYMFVIRPMSGGGGRGGGALGFGKSKAKLLNEKHGKKTFADVAGIPEAKEELREIVDFLKEPAKFQKLGGQIPKGCLLVGPPGTGKTLLARSIAGEADVPFFTISGSDFVEMFVGVGASRVRDMFEQGKKNAPCIIFIDEIDAVGRHRGMGIGGGNDEREQTLNQLLVEMDGFESNEGVIILAATNRPDVLDPALLRPGRFDRQITVPNPDIEGRKEILEVHMRNKPIAPDVDARVIARGTPGFSGADLANLVNEAALLAARNNKKVITMVEMEAAKDKVMMGVERKSMVMSDEEKKMTAYHEAGHAIVSLHCPASDPIHKATIIPRGRSLGMVMRLPESDKISYLRDKMYADLAVAMGGRIAEEIMFGRDKVSSGAASDIQHASDLARHMVREWGMSDELGPINYATTDSAGFKQEYSPELEAKIDAEVRKIIDEAYQKAKEILTNNKDELEKLGEALLEYETLTGDEIKALLAGEDIKKARAKDSKPKTSKSILPSPKKTGKKQKDDNGTASGKTEKKAKSDSENSVEDQKDKEDDT